MDKTGNWNLAPAYDLTYSSTSTNEHSTGVAGEGANPGRKNLIELAHEFSINKPNEIIDQVQEALSNWPKIAKECGVSKASIQRIQSKFNLLKS